MNIRLDDNHVDLRADQILRFEHAPGITITCLRGSLWITQYRDSRDVMLACGDDFALDRRGVCLISATGASSLRLDEKPVSRGWAARFADMLWQGALEAATLAAAPLVQRSIHLR